MKRSGRGYIWSLFQIFRFCFISSIDRGIGFRRINKYITTIIVIIISIIIIVIIIETQPILVKGGDSTRFCSG